MVAFHFQFANQAGWKCDGCRKSGLERRRKCGWLGFASRVDGSPVWARKHVVVSECPKSYVSAESMAFVEDFSFRRRFGQMDLTQLTARQAEAFMVLESELAREIKDGDGVPQYTS